MTQAPWRRLSNKSNPLHLWAVCSVSPGAQPGHPDHLSKRAPRSKAPREATFPVHPCCHSLWASQTCSRSSHLQPAHPRFSLWLCPESQHSLHGPSPLQPVSSLLSASPTSIWERTDPLIAGLGFILLYASAFPTQSLDQPKVSPHVSKGSHMTTTGR